MTGLNLEAVRGVGAAGVEGKSPALSLFVFEKMMAQMMAKQRDFIESLN